MKPKSTLGERLGDVFRGEWRVFWISLFVTCGTFDIGFDSVATGGFQGMPGFLAVFGYKDPTNPLGYNLDANVQTQIQSLMPAGSLATAFIVYLLGSGVGRKTALWVACALNLVATTLQVASTNLASLYAGRFLLGMSNGILVPYGQMWITETCPSLLRGIVYSASLGWFNLGNMVAVIVNDATSRRLDRWSYQIPLILTYIPTVVVVVLLVFVPDTPRYYIIKGDYDRAVHSMQRLRGINDLAACREQVEEIKNAYLVEHEAKGQVHFLDIFRGTDLRRTMIIYGITIVQVANGFAFLTMYSVYFLAQAQVANPFLWVMVTYILALTGNVAGALLLRYWRRRPAVPGGLAGMAACMFAAAATASAAGPGVGTGRVLVAASAVHVWLVAAAVLPASACIASEITTLRLRAEMSGTSTLLSFGTTLLITNTVPYFINPERLNWGAKYAYVWGGGCVVMAAWAWAYLPETAGRSLEQIDEMFESKVPSRKFHTYITERQNLDEKYLRRANSSPGNSIQSSGLGADQIVEVVELKT